jgi:hypothetical protein
MKKLFYLLLYTLILVSCGENSKEIKSDIEKLNSYKSTLQSQTSVLKDSIDFYQNELADLKSKTIVQKDINKGKTPHYILKLKLKQSHFSLSLTKHIKDAMNAIEFEIPVDKDYYNSVSEGTEIVDNFRTASLILSGSFGSWEMSVVSKYIKY